MSNDWFQPKSTPAKQGRVNPMRDDEASPIPGAVARRALDLLRGQASPISSAERPIADIRQALLQQQLDQAPANDQGLEDRVAALLARIDAQERGDSFEPASPAMDPAETRDAELWLQALAGHEVADAVVAAQAADLRAALLDRQQFPVPDEDEIARRADRLLRQFDQIERQDKSLDILSGKRPATDDSDRFLADLRQALITRESAAPPARSFTTRQMVRAGRAEKSLLNVAPLLEPWYPGGAESGVPTRRVEGYDFAFATEKISNAIYLLLSANWSETELQHPQAFDRSFLAVGPGLLRELVADTVSLLAKDAMAHPGAMALDIRVVCTIPEQRLEMNSRLQRLRLKMQRADLILSHFGPPAAGLQNQNAVFELGMATMLPSFEGNLFILQASADESRPGINRDFLLRYLEDQPALALLRTLAPFSLTRCAASLPDDMTRAFEALNKAGRWGLLLYLKLRNLALRRDMIRLDSGAELDPLLAWMNSEEIFSAEARRSLSTRRVHA